MRTVKLVLIALAALAMLGCTYASFDHQPGGAIKGRWINVMQRKGLDLDRTTGTLHIGYNTDSDAMAGVLTKGIELGQSMAKAAK